MEKVREIVCKSTSKQAIHKKIKHGTGKQIEWIITWSHAKKHFNEFIIELYLHTNENWFKDFGTIVLIKYQDNWKKLMENVIARKERFTYIGWVFGNETQIVLNVLPKFSSYMPTRYYLETYHCWKWIDCPHPTVDKLIFSLRK
jgi:hypothetical protein